MSRAAFIRQRLPCLGLFFCAAAGIVLGRYAALPGWAFATPAVILLLAAFAPRLRATLPLGVALTFAAAQAWQFRESAAARLADTLSFAEQSAVAEFTVLEEPRRAGLRACRFVARLHRLQIGDRTWLPGCRVLVTWNAEPPPGYGGRYRARAAISNCPPARNPGAFDYSAWLANAGIRSQLQVLHARDAELRSVGGNPLVRFANASRAWIERTISLGIEGTPEAVLIRAMTIGDTAGADDAIKDAFRETGTFHLFSVSGLHVGIVAVLLWTALGLVGVSQRRSVLIIIPALFFYALLTGLSPASLRAAIMLSLIAAGLLLDRPPSPLNSIGAAGLVILLGDTSQLFNSGFQLSFGAVTAIILLALPLQRRIESLFAPDPFLPTRLISGPHHAALRLATGTAALIAVSFAAWLASLPLTIFYFHLISLSSIPANLLAVPLSSAALALAAIAVVVGAFSPWLAAVFNNANYLLAKILLSLVQSFAALPGSAIYVGPPAAPRTLATLTVLDAGPGGATALLAGGRSWLFDPGSNFFASMVTLPFLRMNGVNELDALVLSHGDAKHIGGGANLIPALHPRRVLDSGLRDRSPSRKRLIAAIAAAGLPLTRATAGFSAPLSPDVRVSVLYPPPEAEGVYADDKALVLRVEAGRFAALLVSDAGIATEQWLLARDSGRLACDVLVMGRHVSGHSGNEDFLRACRPRVLIATAATFPETEQIRPDWAQSVAALGIDLQRQDITGAVTVTIQRDRFIIAPFLPAGGPSRPFPISNATDPLR